MWTPRPILNPWTPDQARVAACFPRFRRVCVPAANGVGKTYLAADLVATFIADMPAARIIITAPTNRQVSELLWPHVTERLLALDLADDEWIIPTKPKWAGGDGDKLTGFATNTAEKLQGFHAENLLIVIDEASGMPRSLTTAMEGIANAEDNYILAIGNPNKPSGPFHNMTRLPSWHTEELSALTHPNILTHSEQIPGATSWPALVARIRDWCQEVNDQTEDTFTIDISETELQIGDNPIRSSRTFSPNDDFRVRYLGRFPNAAEWTLIARSLINRAYDAILPGALPKVAALDVARTGGDRTIYGLRVGDTVTSLRPLRAQDLMKQAYEVAAILKVDQPSSITVDAAGLGIGLIDRLREQTDVPVIAFQGAEEPISPAQQKQFFNRRSAAYGYLADAFANNRISIPKDEGLAEELQAIRYKHTDDGRMQMMRKEEIKKTLGRSPDMADMLSLLWERGTDYSWGAQTIVTVNRPEIEPW